MAANATTADDAIDIDSGGSPGRRRTSGKALVLFVLLPLILLGAAAGGLVMAGIVDPFGAGAAEEDGVPPAPDPRTLVFYDLPEMLVNLNANGKRASYLKIRVSLEVASAADQEHLQALAPRIVDNFQIYLRELRTSDLKGSAGMARLREELLRRVNAAIEPLAVRDVLFREMLVQ